MTDWTILIQEFRMYFAIPFFWMGASVASFYQNLAYRISVYFYSQERKKYTGFSRWKLILFKPSSCENCKKVISPVHLIPIFGYVFSKGRCPLCGYKIPVLYPLEELFFGGFSVFVLWLHPNPLTVVFFLLLMGHLLISMYTDAKFFSLDYENLVWICIWGVGLNLILEETFPRRTEGLVFLGFFGFFLILHLFYPKGVGMGDVLFAPVFAFLATHPWWLFFLNSSYIPAIVFTLLIRKKGEPIRNIPIPMGVYFCIGIFLTLSARLVFERFGVNLEYE